MGIITLALGVVFAGIGYQLYLSSAEKDFESKSNGVVTVPALGRHFTPVQWLGVVLTLGILVPLFTLLVCLTEGLPRLVGIAGLVGGTAYIYRSWWAYANGFSLVFDISAKTLRMPYNHQAGVAGPAISWKGAEAVCVASYSVMPGYAVAPQHEVAFLFSDGHILGTHYLSESPATALRRASRLAELLGLPLKGVEPADGPSLSMGRPGRILRAPFRPTRSGLVMH